MRKIVTIVPPSRDHDWVSESQIKKHLPEFYRKVEEVKDNLDYSVTTRNIVHNIAEALTIHEIISWKQYDTVLNCSKQPTLVGIPTVTRTMPVPAMFRHIFNTLNERHWKHAFDEESITIGDL